MAISKMGALKTKLKALFANEKFYIWATISFLLFQWLIIAITSVNIPAGDEWENLAPGGFTEGFSWRYVFSFLNEHRGVFTRLQNLAFLYGTGWNIVYQIHFNYILFCGMIYFLFWFQKTQIPGATKGVWCLLFFLASPLIEDNHNWAIQSFFHYCELFGLLAMYFATKQSLRLKDYFLAVLFAAFSAYAFATGMFFALMTVVVLSWRLLKGSEKVGVRVIKLASILALVSAMAFWFVGYHKVPGHPAFVWPHEWAFWNFFANLISLGFGFKTDNIVVALLALGAVTVVLWSSLKEAFSFKRQFISFAFFASLAVIGALASIALSRTGFGIGQAKTSRYAELSFLLVPFIGWLWWHLAKTSVRFRQSHRYLIWFICLGYLGNYSYATYFKVQRDREEALVCIGKYYTGENKEGRCPVLHPAPLAERLDEAKRMKLSWVPL